MSRKDPRAGLTGDERRWCVPYTVKGAHRGFGTLTIRAADAADALRRAELWHAELPKRTTRAVVYGVPVEA